MLPTPTPTLTLAELPPGCLATVDRVQAPDGFADWPHRLHDLGFVPGEHVVVLRRALLGGDRLVVRVGTSTYALRRAEAGCVQVHRRVAPHGPPVGAPA